VWGLAPCGPSQSRTKTLPSAYQPAFWVLRIGFAFRVSGFGFTFRGYAFGFGLTFLISGFGFSFGVSGRTGAS